MDDKKKWKVVFIAICLVVGSLALIYFSAGWHLRQHGFEHVPGSSNAYYKVTREGDNDVIRYYLTISFITAVSEDEAALARIAVIGADEEDLEKYFKDKNAPKAHIINLKWKRETKYHSVRYNNAHINEITYEVKEVNPNAVD